jgi:hypothetical protein
MSDLDYRTKLVGYACRFKSTRVHSVELQNPLILQYYIQNGFKYIKRHERHFDFIVRNPTIGCMLELSYQNYPFSVPIDSPAARKMINKLCYF